MRLISAEQAAPSEAVPVTIPAMDVKMEGAKILDFDIENRPLAYLGMDYTSGELTAIAWSWVGDDHVEVRLLGIDHPAKILLDFKKAYDEADIVTGHYIRKHDLPIINGALIERKLPSLSKKNSIDTKLDLVRSRYISCSQESLATMYELENGKHHMTQTAWRDANRLTPKGIELTRKRVIDDVVQHKELRLQLKEQKLLHAPKEWRP